MEKDVLQFFDLNQIGYTRLLNCILRSRNLFFGEKVILNILFSHAHNFRDCKIKHTTIAKEAGYSVSTVKRYLGCLKQKNIIDWRKISFGRCNQYSINSIIGELIEKIVSEEGKSFNQFPVEPAISSGLNSQRDHPWSNETKTTTENKFSKTNKEISNKKSFRGNFRELLDDSGLEAKARYLAEQLNEQDQLPKYRRAVTQYRLVEIDKALGYAQDLRRDGKIEKNLAAVFWDKLKRVSACR